MSRPIGRIRIPVGSRRSSEAMPSFGPVGPLELIIVLAIALLLLGPKRLPELGSAVGKTIREFRKAASEAQEEANLDRAPTPAPGTAPSGSEVVPNRLRDLSPPNTAGTASDRSPREG
jgi:sec-independent protein translocase protein TatA